MKKYVKILLVVGLLLSMLNAKNTKIFDLKDQYFSGTLLKKGQEGFGQEEKYDLPKVIVTTDTRFNGYSYMFGLFTVDLKEPLENWNVIIKKKSGVLSSNNMTIIRITSESGNSYIVYFSYEYIQINDKRFNTSYLNNKKLTVSISKKNNIVLFRINGKAFLKTNGKDFGKLKKIEIELNDNKYDDELLALEIYKVN